MGTKHISITLLLISVFIKKRKETHSKFPSQMLHRPTFPDLKLGGKKWWKKILNYQKINIRFAKAWRISKLSYCNILRDGIFSILLSWKIIFHIQIYSISNIVVAATVCYTDLKNIYRHNRSRLYTITIFSNIHWIQWTESGSYIPKNVHYIICISKGMLP